MVACVCEYVSLVTHLSLFILCQPTNEQKKMSVAINDKTASAHNKNESEKRVSDALLNFHLFLFFRLILFLFVLRVYEILLRS